MALRKFTLGREKTHVEPHGDVRVPKKPQNNTQHSLINMAQPFGLADAVRGYLADPLLTPEDYYATVMSGDEEMLKAKNKRTFMIAVTTAQLRVNPDAKLSKGQRAMMRTKAWKKTLQPHDEEPPTYDDVMDTSGGAAAAALPESPPLEVDGEVEEADPSAVISDAVAAMQRSGLKRELFGGIEIASDDADSDEADAAVEMDEGEDDEGEKDTSGVDFEGDDDGEYPLFQCDYDMDDPRYMAEYKKHAEGMRRHNRQMYSGSLLAKLFAYTKDMTEEEMHMHAAVSELSHDGVDKHGLMEHIRALDKKNKKTKATKAKATKAKAATAKGGGEKKPKPKSKPAPKPKSVAPPKAMAKPRLKPKPKRVPSK